MLRAGQSECVEKLPLNTVLGGTGSTECCQPGQLGSSFQRLLLWETQCLLQYSENLAPTCHYPCSQELPCSAAGHMKIRIPVAQHVMEKALSCFSSAHIPVPFRVYRALPGHLQGKTLSFLGKWLPFLWSSPASGWGFLISAVSLLRYGNRMPRKNQHVGTSGITQYHKQICPILPPSILVSIPSKITFSGPLLVFMLSKI